MALKTHALRITGEQRRHLIAMNLRYVLYRTKDIGFKMPGSIESAFSYNRDASDECNRLCAIYQALAPDSFAVVDLKETH